jgi:iron complex transport system ATP-binding protein
MGLVLTDKTAAGGFKVRELVELGRYPYTGFFGKLTPAEHQIVEQAMSDVGIAHKADSYIAELSDGERQKAMIAKALSQECPIIVLDEPTAFLDIVNRIEIMQLLHRLTVTHRKAILLSTHDIELALSLSDRLWMLSKDKGLMCGVTEDVILSGLINEYIGNGSISFDQHSGRFSSPVRADKQISLKADGILFHWARNFLLRNGFNLSDEAATCIRVHSPHSISIQSRTGTDTFRSFEEAGNYLRINREKI